MVQRYIPAKIAPWQRKWRVATYLLTATAAYYLTFWHNWSRLALIPKDHALSGLQYAHREQLKRLLGERYVKDVSDPYELVADSKYDREEPATVTIQSKDNSTA